MYALTQEQMAGLGWFKSSFSANGACVEAARVPGVGVAVRDTKHRCGGALVFRSAKWQAFISSAKAGEFDPC